MKKQIIAFALCLTFLVIFVTPPNALAYTNTVSATTGLVISGTTATCTAMIVGQSGITKIEGILTIKRKNSNGTYSEVASWTSTTTSSLTLIMSKTYTLTPGNYYYVALISKCSRASNTSTETLVKTTAEIYCG
ncbi:hypothetical protein FACS1894217_11460 [Clostridia bacterium]|nr:hypothetical protein FACS1894217_11460 [Clostridia bacterium]